MSGTAMQTWVYLTDFKSNYRAHVSIYSSNGKLSKVIYFQNMCMIGYPLSEIWAVGTWHIIRKCSLGLRKLYCTTGTSN